MFHRFHALQAVALLALLCVALCPSLASTEKWTGSRDSVVFDSVTPASAIILLRNDTSPFIHLITARKSRIDLWGYRMAFLHYNGKWARGQNQRGYGPDECSILNIEYNMEREASYYRKHIVPAQRVPFAPAAVEFSELDLLPPRSDELALLRDNLARREWESLVDLFDEEEIIRRRARQEQYNGLLHEAMHAFDSPKPGEELPIAKRPQWEWEERCHLTALRHSQSPHQIWRGILGQYKRGEGIYFQAVQSMLENTVAHIYANPNDYPTIDTSANIMSQLYKLNHSQLNNLASHAWLRKYAVYDRLRKYDMNYSSPPIISEHMGLQVDTPDMPIPALNLAPAKKVSADISSGTPVVADCYLHHSNASFSLQETWGKTHWRLRGDGVVGVSFHTPKKFTKATLQVVHMETADTEGKGGQTFVMIQVDETPVVRNHQPPSEKINQLETPEEFDITPLLKPDTTHMLAFTNDPSGKTRLVYWLQRFEVVFE
jgi:hypothetical protein